jgi:hypothetical protein
MLGFTGVRAVFHFTGLKIHDVKWHNMLEQHRHDGYHVFSMGEPQFVKNYNRHRAHVPVL